MNDVFNEQLVKKEKNTKDTLIKIGIVLLAFIIIFVCLFIPYVNQFIMFVVIAVGFGAYYLISRLNLEYEYILTNGELDIDCIYNKAKRKRLFTGEAKSFEIFAHVEDKGYESIFGKAEILDCSSGIVKKNTYAFLATYKGKKLKIIIEPNEALLKALSPLLGQRKHIKV